MLSVTYMCPHSECRYAGCRYSECRGAVSNQPNDATASLTAKEPMNKDWIKTFHSVPPGNVNI
jgi:hypothetical protein